MIATLATRAAADGHRRRSSSPVTVTATSWSSDPHVKVLYNRRGVSDYVLYDEAGIVERTGVTPAQYPEYAALRGDPSDNLPGVPGVGEKTAAKLINTYGNLEGIYEHLDELPPKQRQNLGEARDRVFLNRQMSLLAARRATSTSRPSDLAHGRVGPRAGAGAVRPARVPHALPAAARGGGGASAADAEAGTTLDVEVVRRPRDAAAALDAFGRGRGERRAVRGRGALGRRAGHAARCARLAHRTTDGRRRRTSTPTLLARSRGRAALLAPRRRRRPAARRAPGQGADARPRRRRAVAAPRHRGDGVPPRPGRGEVPPRRPRAAVPLARGAVARRRARARSISTATSRSTRPAGVPRGAPARRRARRRRSTRASSPISTSGSSVRSSACWPSMETARHPHRPRVPRGRCARSSPSSATCSCSASTRTRARSST